MSALGRHEAGQQPAGQPWARTSDRSVWRAYKSGLTLTVTHLVTGGWLATTAGLGPIPARQERNLGNQPYDHH